MLIVALSLAGISERMLTEANKTCKLLADFARNQVLSGEGGHRPGGRDGRSLKKANSSWQLAISQIEIQTASAYTFANHNLASKMVAATRDAWVTQAKYWVTQSAPTSQHRARWGPR